ncbi:retropepsin-like aspartic protease [Pedobacter montanisoli]|uniref:Retroviral-like aspartic protease family protein n=1 Tax=Pedobacter montanisoli TaxID=2923277 RepID=A0ABS9ZR89_9SPHI|nr:retropepsin-like aspartic protease [Pedobacter montanisoli]MCJ0741107.1 retroviral-like aspartic protease family protein [Pedobacter montanisoli]
MKLYKLVFTLVALCLFLSSSAQQAVTSIPFEMVNGSIVLKVKINNSSRTLRLLFDTGADGMAVSKALADTIGLKVTRTQKASVVGGSMDISVSAGNDITFDNGFVLKGQSIAIFNELSKGLDGIIGNAMTFRYITKIDFNTYQLSLYNFDDYQPEKTATIVPVSSSSGIFIIDGNVELLPGKTYTGKFVFDTGASYSLICFRPFVKQNKLLVSGFKSEYQSSTVSMGIASPTFGGRASAFSFTNVPSLKNIPITLMAGGGQNENWSPGFDGSIGMRIITRYNFTINRKKNEIYLTPNHSYTYPHDFILGGYMLGFNLFGELQISGKTSPATYENGLPDGTVITSLNNVSTKQLVKDPKKLEQILQLPKGNGIKAEYVKDGKTQTLTLNH